MRSRSSLLVLAVIASCSSGSNPFEGTWECTLTETVDAAGGYTSTQKIPKTISITLIGDAKLHAAGAGYSNATCPLDFTATGATATLIAGQSCNVTGGAVAYSSGTTSVDGSSLKADVAFTLPPDSGGRAQSGTGSFACAKR